MAKLGNVSCVECGGFDPPLKEYKAKYLGYTDVWHPECRKEYIAKYPNSWEAGFDKGIECQLFPLR